MSARPRYPRVLHAVSELAWLDAEHGGDGWVPARAVAQLLYPDLLFRDGRTVAYELRHLEGDGYVERQRRRYKPNAWALTERGATWLRLHEDEARPTRECPTCGRTLP